MSSVQMRKNEYGACQWDGRLYPGSSAVEQRSDEAYVARANRARGTQGLCPSGSGAYLINRINASSILARPTLL